MSTRSLCSAAAVAILLVIPASAGACASDQTSYLNTFANAECLLLGPGTEIDADGGLRLKTGGAATPTTWDTAAQFDNPPAGGPGSLDVVGTDQTATLELKPAELPLTREAPALSTTGGALTPGPTQVRDSEGVEDPSVIRAGTKYVMYYTGYAEDGSPPAIYRVESNDGRTWARPPVVGADPNPAAVLQATPGAFDANGVFGADVLHDPNDAAAPYRMYYSGVSEGLRAIGYATSTDGVSWVKHGTANGGLPQPVLKPGLPGARDAFAVAHPSVIKDGALYKMWYEADDSTVKAIGYATSVDGVVWQRGGLPETLQQDPLDPGDPKVGQGVGAPAVWKTPNGFRMVVVARNGGNPTNTRLMDATSDDGIDWSELSPEINPQAGQFYASNFLSPDMLHDPADAAAPYKLYFAGDRAIASPADDRARIGVATGGSPTGSYNVYTGGNDPLEAIFNPGADSTRFDARNVLGLSVADPGAANDWVGAYAGTRSVRGASGTTSSTPRLGIATYDAEAAAPAWVKRDGAQSDKSILATATEDASGQRDPHLVYRSGPGDDWFLFYTALPANGNSSVRLATAPEGNAQSESRPGAWSKSATFQIGGASHPSVLRDAAQPARIYYTLEDGTPDSIALLTTTNNDDLTAAGGAAATELSFTGTATCDPNGAKDPVVIKIGTVVHLLYTGLDGARRNTCYATADSTQSYLQFARKGFVIAPSDVAFAYDETRTRPAGMFVDAESAGAPLNVFLTGTDGGERKWVEVSQNVYEQQVFNQRTRVGRATSPIPITAGRLPSGSATGQLGSAAGPLVDFRKITRVKTGSKVEMFMSVLQPYSTQANQFWSDWFPVVESGLDTASQELTFRFGVRAARWRARLSEPSNLPKLDTVTVESGPLQFEPSGTATTTDVTPPSGFALGGWTNLILKSEAYTFPGAAATPVNGTVTVLGVGDAPVVPATALTLNEGTEQTISLAGVPAAAHPKLKVKFDLSAGAAEPKTTPLVKQLRVTYTSADAPSDSDRDGVADATDQCPTTPGTAATAGCPDADGDGVADAADACPNLAAPGQPSGCPDSDGDGIPDPQDACPALAAPGQANGCPPDADRDGVPDAQDACPAIAVPGSPNGCPLALTLTSSARLIVYGAAATLSGTLLRGPAPVPGQIVTVRGQAVGSAAPKPIGTAVTDVTGRWVLVVKPRLHTTYSVVLTGVAAPAPLAIRVRHKLTLRIQLSGRRATFSGTLGPRHARRTVTLQRRSGTRWVRLTRLRTNSRSAFRLTRRLRRGTYQFRVVTGRDTQHAAGRSPARRLRVR